MRLDLRPILHVPGASVPFAFQLDLSGLDFYGVRPFQEPVQVSGQVRNRADALVLSGEAVSTLDLRCDRCLKPFRRELRVPVECLLAEELEDGDMDTTHLCAEDCRGLCARCGADLNQGPCGCGPEPDPRFAALAQLLDKESK